MGLLEVGTGFHPELTGRENIFLNGAILGMTRAEIDRKFDEIVAFAEVEQFLDTPVKRYSQRHVRATGVRGRGAPRAGNPDRRRGAGRRRRGVPEEVPRARCSEVAASGRTVLFVSHNMSAVRYLCEHAILFENGRLATTGEPGAVISRYLSASRRIATSKAVETKDAPKSEDMRLRGIRMLNGHGMPRRRSNPTNRSPWKSNMKCCRYASRGALLPHAAKQEGEIAFSATDHQFQQETQMPGTYRTSCFLPGGLLNRRQYVVHLQCDDGERYVLPAAVHRFTVSGIGNQSSTFPEPWPGVVCPRISWKVEEFR